MKADIHPKWYPDAKISCACGAVFVVGSTKPSIQTDICSKCHPFFTGEMKFVDTMGRVQKFQKKQEVAKVRLVEYQEKKKKKQEKAEQLRNPKSLKDMLMGMK